MTASTLTRLSTLPNLRKNWMAFWRAHSGQRSSGVDRVTLDDFHRSLTRNLERVQKELRSGYRFSPLRGHPIPKPDGKRCRIICVPTVQDRLVQRVLTAHLTELADRLGIINEVSYGFVPTKDGRRRGVLAARGRAIELRRQYPWAYKSDISAFFDRIPRDEVIRKTVGALRARSLRDILSSAASCEIDDSDPAVNRIAKENGIIRGLGVRQGMPLSPLFANIILRDFDREMVRQGKRLVRYADDFIVFAATEAECYEVDSLARKLLGSLDFELPPLGQAGSKTMLAAPTDGIDFLGLSLAPNGNGDYALLLTPAQLEKVNRSLNGLKDVDQLVDHGITLPMLTETVENKIGGYLAAYRDAANIDDLQVVLSKARTQILRSVFVTAFGEERVQKLSPAMRKFLCLEAL